MAYNYVPYQHNPNRGFEDYAGEQFKGLFDIANAQANPLQGFAQTPVYSPNSVTRADFSTPSYQAYTMSDDGAYDNLQTFPGSFDQQGYMDARFGNISDYLGKLGSYFGNMGSPTGQQILANAPSQGPRPPMPTIGSNLNLGGSTGGTNINNPFPSFGIGANAGWGTPPTSLFGAGANATNT